MPCRNMGAEDADFASAAPSRSTWRASPSWPGRPDVPARSGTWGALFSRKYGQSTGVCMFDRVFVPWESVFYAGEWNTAAT